MSKKEITIYELNKLPPGLTGILLIKLALFRIGNNFVYLKIPAYVVTSNLRVIKNYFEKSLDSRRLKYWIYGHFLVPGQQ